MCDVCVVSGVCVCVCVVCVGVCVCVCLNCKNKYIFVNMLVI